MRWKEYSPRVEINHFSPRNFTHIPGVTSSRYRIVKFRGEKWFISTLGEYSFQRTYLGLKASMQKGISG